MEVIKSSRQVWQAVVLEAESLKKEGNFAAAEARLLEGWKAFPDEMWLLFHYALIASVQWKWDAAVQRWSEFCVRFGDNPTGFFQLSQALLRANRIVEADTAVDTALAKFGYRIDLLSVKIDILIMHRKWDSAIYLGNLRREHDVSAENMQKFSELPTRVPSYRVNDFVHVFSYWSGDSFPKAATVGFWNHIFGPNYKVINDDIVVDLLGDLYPSFAKLYTRIRIPACKADVARLVYLYVYGGLYLDMHCTLGNYNRLDTISALNKDHDAVFFTNPEKSGDQIINSILLCKKGAKTIGKILDLVIDNLTRHFWHEVDSSEHIKYNVYCLSGPMVISQLVYSEPRLDASFSFMGENIGTVKIARDSLVDCFIPFHFYSYRKPGQHWSERQENERLFSQAD